MRGALFGDMELRGRVVVLIALLAGRGGGELWAQPRATLAAVADSAPLSPFLRQKTEALLREQLACLGCHSLNGDGGAVGPDLTTVRQRRSADYVAAMILDPERMVPGTAMPRPMLAPGTLSLVTRYFAATATQAAAAGGSDTGPATAARGTGADRSAPALYARYCAACHGAGGRGDGPNAARLPVSPANHASREAMSVRPDDSLFDTIAGGGAIMNRSPRMPAYGATLTRAEIRSLVRHIRTLCKCEGPAWSRDGASHARGGTPPGPAGGGRR